MAGVRVLALAAATAVALTGCTGMSFAGERRGTAASADALALAWSTPASQPQWLPADATRIRSAITTMRGADASPAALRAAPSTALPKSCRTATAADAAPGIDASWTPRLTGAVVQRCGNWLVTRVDDGYYGWTPAT